MSTSLYNIAVRLTMVSNHGPLLSVLAHDILGVHHGLNAATLAAGCFRTAIAGAATAFIGTGLLTYMGKIVDKGGEFARTMDRMRLAGWSSGDIGHATETAFGTARRYPSLPAGLIMEMQREMAPVLGSRTEAMHVTDTVAQLMRVLQIHRGPEHTEALHGEIVAAVRAGELTANTLTDTRFRHFIEMMTPSIHAWGGLLTPQDFAQAFKYSRAAGLNMSDRFMQQVLPTLMQELGASSTGTAFQTAYQAVIGGRMRLHSLNAFADMGLIDRSRVTRDNLTPEGRLRRMQPGLMVGSGLYMTDPDLWVQRHLIPSFIRSGLITKQGYDAILAGDLHSPLGEATRKAITAQIAVMWADRTGQQLIDTLALQPRKLGRDAGLVVQSPGLAASQSIIDQNYGMAKAGVHGAWKTFLAAVGFPQTAAATEGLNMLSGAIGGLTDAVRGMNPQTVKDIFMSVGAGLAAFTVGGVIALAGAIIGWKALLIVAIGGALVGVGTYLWQNRGWVAEIAAKIGEALMAIPGMLGSAIAGMASGIASSIGAAIRGLLSGGGNVPGVPPPGSADTLTGRGGGEGLLPGFTPLQRQNWVPPARQNGGLVPIRNVITIDGHRIAEAVSHYIAVANTHVQSAAQYDGGLSHVPVDMQFA